MIERLDQMPTIRQVIYISKATYEFSASEVRELAAVAARNNALEGITGALLFIDNSFIQVIEGDERAMSHMLTRLKADPRHHDIRIISDQLAESRHFADWSMGLISTPDEDRPRVTRELRAASDITSEEEALVTNMPMPHTAAKVHNRFTFIPPLIA